MATDDFPVDSFKDAAQHLRRPFTPAAVKFKVQATWPKDNPSGGLIVSYIDARLAVERLNLVCPHLWSDSFHAIGQNQMWCDLTVDGITRHDVGEGQSKGLVSDALKRAAVKFGVGVSLYAIPKMTLNVSDGTVKPRRVRDGMSLEITPKGEKHLRALYEKWLEDHGARAFGDPLDHGDVDGAQGDHEADTPAPDALDQPQPAEPRRRDVERTGESDIPSDTAPAKIGESGAALILGRAKDAGIDRDRVRKAAWHAAGQPPDGHLSVEGSFDADQVAIAMLSQFTEDGKARLLKWIAKAEQAAKGETS